MFYPSEGLCGAEPERGPIVFTLHFIGVGRGTGGFKFTGGFFCPFEILKMFYPPEGLCRAEPERGPIVFTLDFIGVGRGTGGFQFENQTVGGRDQKFQHYSR